MSEYKSWTLKTLVLLGIIFLVLSPVAYATTGKPQVTTHSPTAMFTSQQQYRVLKPSTSTKSMKLDKDAYTVKMVTGDTVYVNEKNKIIGVMSGKEKTSTNRYIYMEIAGNTYVIPNLKHLEKIDLNMFNINILKTIQSYLDKSKKNLNYRFLIELNTNPPALVKNKDKYITIMNEYATIEKLAFKYNVKVVREYKILPLLSVELTDKSNVIDFLNAVTSLPTVKKVWMDYIVTTQDIMLRNPGTVSAESSNTEIIGAPVAWSHGLTGENITIAILDTGIYSHPDLADRITLEKSFIDYDFDQQADESTFDYYGHGTHVAGIAAGGGVLSEEYKGVAPGANLWNLKVLNANGWGFDSWIISGIEFAVLGPDGNITTPDGADIISMSLGAPVPSDGSDPLSEAVDEAYMLGVLPVVAAGNSGPEYGTVGIPASAHYAITVGALNDPDIGMAYFSSRGPTLDGRLKPEVAAPGVRIESALARGSYIERLAYMYPYFLDPIDVNNDSIYDYVALSGTSMATPHVSGTAAILKQLLENKTVNASIPITSIMRSLIISTTDYLPTGDDPLIQGTGLINITRMINSPIIIQPDPVINLGVYTASSNKNITVPITLNCIGPGASENVTYNINLTWFLYNILDGKSYYDALQVSPDNLTLSYGDQAVFNASIDLSLLPTGYYTGIIEIRSGGQYIGKVVISFAKLALVNITALDEEGRPASGIVEVVPLSVDYSNLGLFDYYTSQPIVLSNGKAIAELPAGQYAFVYVKPGSGSPLISIYADNIYNDTNIVMDGRNSRFVNINYPSNLTIYSKQAESLIITQYDWYFTGIENLYPDTGMVRVLLGGNLSLLNDDNLGTEFGIDIDYALVSSDSIIPALPELVNSPVWYSLSFDATNLTSDINASLSDLNLAKVDTVYKAPPEADYKAAYRYIDASWTASRADIAITSIVTLPLHRTEYYGPFNETGIFKEVSKYMDLPNKQTPSWASDIDTCVGCLKQYPQLIIDQYPLLPFINIEAYTDQNNTYVDSSNTIFKGGGTLTGDYGECIYGPALNAGSYEIYHNGDMVAQGSLDYCYSWFSETFPFSTGNYTLSFEGYLEGKQTYSGSFAWYSGDGDNLNNMLVYQVDLRNVTNATLSFATKYSIEAGWDHGYVMVSTDGMSWDIIDSFTGRSDNWMVKTYDLTDYTGSIVYIAFLYKTDCCVHWGGWYLDDISIPEIGFHDGAEEGPVYPVSLGGWSIIEQKGYSFKYTVNLSLTNNTSVSIDTPIVYIPNTGLFNDVESPVTGIIITDDANVEMYYRVNKGEWTPVTNLAEAGPGYTFTFTPTESGIVDLLIVTRDNTSTVSYAKSLEMDNALKVQVPPGPEKITFRLGNPYTDVYAGPSKIATIVNTSVAYKDIYYDPTGEKYTVHIVTPGQYIDVYKGSVKLFTYAKVDQYYWNVYAGSAHIATIHVVDNNTLDIFYYYNNNWIKLGTLVNYNNGYMDIFIDNPSMWSIETPRVLLLSMAVQYFQTQ